MMTPLLQSHIININGNFVGAAVRLDSGYRFIALNMRVEELDGTIWPNLDTVRRLARQLFLTGHFGHAHPVGSFDPIPVLAGV